MAMRKDRSEGPSSSLRSVKNAKIKRQTPRTRKKGANNRRHIIIDDAVDAQVANNQDNQAVSLDSAHVYDPLDKSLPQCRIFTLSPAKHKWAPLRGHLSTELLPEVENQYDALSYVWGDQSNKRAITVNDTVFYVTSNLYAALAYLRHETEARRL